MDSPAGRTTVACDRCRKFPKISEHYENYERRLPVKPSKNVTLALPVEPFDM